MRLSFLFFGNKPDIKWALARQMGISHAIAKLSPELTNDDGPWHAGALQRSLEIFNQNGFTLYGLEGDQFDMQRIKFGLPGREQDIERYCQMLEHMGELGIPLLCYNFMAGLGWYRTLTSITQRGGALVSGFSKQYADEQEHTPFGPLEEGRLWDNYAWFLEKVMPSAEAAGVQMALHPDDPPVSPLRGIARIFTNPAAIDKALALSTSKSHALTFCQGTYTTMGANVLQCITKWANRIAFIHVRDVVGTPNNFQETFHDNGPTDMPTILKAYADIGFDGAIRSDHVPSMAGDSNEDHGYSIHGSLFGVGYIKGMMDALYIKNTSN